MMKFPVLLLILHAILSITAWSQPLTASASLDGEYPFRIVATTGMLGDAIENIVGDKALVEVLMGPGVDPHLYKASQRDVRKFDEADIIYYSGLHLEGKMVEFMKKIGRFKPAIPAAEVLSATRLMNLEEEGESQASDPHVWFDASLWADVAQGIGYSLAQYDRKNHALYLDNARVYRQKLLDLDQWAREQIGSIPKKQRLLVTAHDAFRYFGRAYGIEVLALQGISTAAEYGLNDINRLVDIIVQRKIKALFVETSIPSRSIQAVQEGCRTRGHEAVIGESLYSDAMGDKGTPEGTYLGMFRHNVNAIVSGLK